LQVFFDGDQRHSRMVLRDLVWSIFEALDTDGDGRISLAEWQPFCEKHDITVGAFHDVDMQSDSDCLLSFTEFKQLLLRADALAAEVGAEGRYTVARTLFDAVATSMFVKADGNGDGSISFDEARGVLESYGLLDDGQTDDGARCVRGVCLSSPAYLSSPELPDDGELRGRLRAGALGWPWAGVGRRSGRGVV
jgi:hypothetical protein